MTPPPNPLHTPNAIAHDPRMSGDHLSVRAFRRSLAWVVGASFLCLATLVVTIYQRANAPPPLPRLGTVPTFERVDEHDRPMSERTLSGSVWIADFIFLSCPTSCPQLTARMATLQSRIAERAAASPTERAIRLVSFTVDPDNDTPPKLLEYARKYGARDGAWSFLTGPRGELERVIVQGFKMQYERTAAPASSGASRAAGSPEEPTVFTIMHGDWFVLVDALGNIRGYYDTSTPQRFDELVADARRLAGPK